MIVITLDSVEVDLLDALARGPKRFISREGVEWTNAAVNLSVIGLICSPDNEDFILSWLGEQFRQHWMRCEDGSAWIRLNHLGINLIQEAFQEDNFPLKLENGENYDSDYKAGD